MMISFINQLSNIVYLNQRSLEQIVLHTSGIPYFCNMWTFYFQFFMSVLRKYHQYLKEFPIDIQSRVLLTNDNDGFIRDNVMYFGPLAGSMKNGGYGISFEKKYNGHLVIKEGSWKKDKLSGKGSAYYIPQPEKKKPNLIIWKQGEWKEDNLHGQGVVKTYNTHEKQWKTIYRGGFKNNFKSGYGELKIENMKYEGQFENDCYHGQGRLTCSNQSYFCGEFRNGRPKGKGVQRRGERIIIYSQEKTEMLQIPQQMEKKVVFYDNFLKSLTF